MSYVDRCSKFTVLKKIENKTAEVVSQATIEKLGQDALPVLTITYDNGKEFSEHIKIGVSPEDGTKQIKKMHFQG